MYRYLDAWKCWAVALLGLWSPAVMGQSAAGYIRQALEDSTWWMYAQGPEARASVIRQETQRFYAGRDFAPAWYHRHRLTGQADSLEKLLEELPSAWAVRQAAQLRPLIAEQRLLRFSERAFVPERQQAETDLLLTLAFVRLAHQSHYGALLPEDFPGLPWHHPLPALDAAGLLSHALTTSQIAGTLRSLRPRDARSLALRQWLARYEQMHAQGQQWPVVPAAVTSLKPGDTTALLLPLRRRLIATGELLTDFEQGMVYDANVENAIVRFQQRHGLEATGIVGTQTLEALNTPLTTRIAQLKANLLRMHWLPRDMGDRYLLVNVPAYTLVAVEWGRIVDEWRVVTGAKRTPTPLFRADMTNLVFYPYWNIPISIARGEVLPGMRKDSLYLHKKRYEVIPMAPAQETALNATGYAKAYRLRQKPGPGNALGRIKFNLPNPWDIYLHDTPSKSFFAKDIRAFSHGCVRVQDPERLAAWLLAAQQWTPDSIAQVIDKGKTLSVHLQQPIPVYLTYQTAWVSTRGELHFRPDIYRHDLLMAHRME